VSRLEAFCKEAAAPIQNKVGQLLMSPPIRNLFGQVQSKLDLRFRMDNRKVLITNLSKGSLGEDKCNLVGALLVSQLQRAAMSRSNMPRPVPAASYRACHRSTGPVA
jgi:hypothetical protein